MDKDTYTDAGVIRQSGQFVPIKLNAEKEGKAQKDKFQISGFPTILFVSPEEKVVWKIVGYMPPRQFEAEMAKANSAFTKRPKWESDLKKDPKNLDAIVGLIPILTQEGNIVRAEALLKQAETADPTNKSGKLEDLYNAVGDYYQMSDRVPQAIPYFIKASKSKDESKAAYALISLAYCHMSARQPKQAQPYLERLLKMGKGADEYRQQAQDMLKQIQG